MEIYSFDSLCSTQKYLVEKIRSGELTAPVAVITAEQSSGIGSRENSWSGGRGNFFASFAIGLGALPEDLSLSSASIYFAFIMKQVLKEYSDEVWLKWPNDLYKDNDKVGGIMTQKIGNSLVCGIGVNLRNSPSGFRGLDSDIPAPFLLEKYLKSLERFPKWKQIFSEYQIEFEHSRRFSVHIESYQKSLQDALLCEDGSLLIEGKRVYSLR
ncbi:MAG TPA: biotin--[acetyl-CoA-carboxylase] ligase [Epsilonproteobacteria bacterium]|nr:biotin--[acetyl-CoA-carboxylase] ligase [Campylobacterota bacterium]